MPTQLAAEPTTNRHFDLMTMDEVSEFVRIPVSTLRFYRHKGEGPRSGKIGGRIMYRRADVEAWIDAAFAAEEAK